MYFDENLTVMKNVESKVYIFDILNIFLVTDSVCRCYQRADLWSWWTWSVDAESGRVLPRSKPVSCTTDCCRHQCMYSLFYE